MNTIALAPHLAGMEETTAGMTARNLARMIGISSLLAMTSAIFANYAIFEQIIVRGNAAATARNILANETLFRFGSVCFLIYVILTLVMITGLYSLLRGVNRELAILAALFRLIYIGCWVATTMAHGEVLRLLGSSQSLTFFEPEQLQALARLRLGTGFDAYYNGLPFYGLAATVVAWLFLKSGWIPRGLAIFGIVASAWCALSGLIFLVVPAFGKAINLYSLDSALGAFELILAIWLIAKGIRSEGATA
jgi:hypothetical protein